MGRRSNTSCGTRSAMAHRLQCASDARDLSRRSSGRCCQGWSRWLVRIIGPPSWPTLWDSGATTEFNYVHAMRFLPQKGIAVLESGTETTHAKAHLDWCFAHGGDGCTGVRGHEARRRHHPEGLAAGWSRRKTRKEGQAPGVRSHL